MRLKNTLRRAATFLGESNTRENGLIPVNINIVKKYFTATDNPDEADVAIAFISSPNTGNGYQADDVKKGGNGYFPISLQIQRIQGYRGTCSQDLLLAVSPLEKLSPTAPTRINTCKSCQFH